MSTLRHFRLDDRARLVVAGADARAFLQNLVTNDMARVAPERAVYAALLTPQGKYLHDFFVLARGEAFWLEAEAARLGDLKRRLETYRLRSKVGIEEAADGFTVFAVIGAGASRAVGFAEEAGHGGEFAGGIAYVDPRLAQAGIRAVLPAETGEAALAAIGAVAGTASEYDAHRLRLGLPAGTRDFVVDKTLPLEYGADELNAVDFAKGCYVGQEVTARMKHRALVRRRLVPVAIEGTIPPAGTTIMAGESEAGEMRSAAGGIGLALLRIDLLAAEGAAFRAGAARITPLTPAWAKR